MQSRSKCYPTIADLILYSAGGKTVAVDKVEKFRRKLSEFGY